MRPRLTDKDGSEPVRPRPASTSPAPAGSPSMPRVTVIARRRKGQHTMATPTDKAAQQLLDLSGKSAVVTGGAMGIGFGIARRLAEAGASVTIADINPEVGESSCEKLRAEGWTAQFVGGNVSVASDVNNMVEMAVNAYGRLDIWVNN